MGVWAYNLYLGSHNIPDRLVYTLFRCVFASLKQCSRKDPVQITLAPGAYGGAAAFAAEINSQISLSATLKNAVYAQVRTVGLVDYVDLVTVEEGSRVQAIDLTLADDPTAPGTLAAVGLAAATIPGGGTAAGQGDIKLPDNIINTMIQIRDELHGHSLSSRGRHDVNVRPFHQFHVPWSVAHDVFHE